jgi:hypothetical protein
MVATLSTIALLAPSPFWAEDVPLAALLADLSGIVGERLEAAPDIGDEPLFVYADRREAPRIVAMLPTLLDCAWEPKAGGRVLVSRRGPEWDVARLQENDRAMLRSFLAWLRSPESASGALPESLWPTLRSGRFLRYQKDPADEVFRAATDAQIESLLAGAVLTGATVPGAADVYVPKPDPDKPDTFFAIYLDEWGGLVYRTSKRGASGPSATGENMLFRPAFDRYEEPGSHMLPGERSAWELLERLEVQHETDPNVVTKSPGYWFESFARETAQPVLGIAVPHHCARAGAMQYARVVDGWVLVRPRLFPLARELRRLAAENYAAYAVPPNATPGDELARALAMPEVYDGFHATVADGLSIVSGKTGVPEFWSALSERERAAALGAGLDYRRLSAEAKKALLRCMARSISGLSAFEICEAVRTLEQGTPLEVKVFRSCFGSIVSNGKWTRLEPDLALPPTASPGDRVVVHGLTFIEIQAGEFRGRTLLGRRFLNSQYYDGPAEGIPDFSSFHRGNGG